MAINRWVLGALLGPAASPLIFFTGMILLSGDPAFSLALLDKGLGILLSTMLISYSISLPTGLFVVILLARIEKLDLVRIVGLAAMIGALGGYIYFAFVAFRLPEQNVPIPTNLFSALICSLVAALNALTFGVVSGLSVRRGNSLAV